MIKQNNNLIQNYTDSDLNSFAKLRDFNNYNVVSNDAKNNEIKSNPLYTFLFS